MEAPKSSSKTLALVRTWRTREGGRKGGKAEELEREREAGRECCCCPNEAEEEEEEEEAVDVGREGGREGEVLTLLALAIASRM
jgi:general stress protein YciG